jgi:hypothetical protein
MRRVGGERHPPCSRGSLWSHTRPASSAANRCVRPLSRYRSGVPRSEPRLVPEEATGHGHPGGLLPLRFLLVGVVRAWEGLEHPESVGPDPAESLDLPHFSD